MGLRSGSVVLVAVRSCLRRGRSAVLRTYALVGLLASLFTAALVLLALPTWVAGADGSSAILLLAPGLLLLAGVAIVAALTAPVLLAHRRLPEPGERRDHERVYGAFGYATVASIYAAFIISAPADDLGGAHGVIEPVVSALNALDRPLAVVPPLAVIALLVVVDRRIGA